MHKLSGDAAVGRRSDPHRADPVRLHTTSLAHLVSKLTNKQQATTHRILEELLRRDAARREVLRHAREVIDQQLLPDKMQTCIDLFERGTLSPTQEKQQAARIRAARTAIAAQIAEALEEMPSMNCDMIRAEAFCATDAIVFAQLHGFAAGADARLLSGARGGGRVETRHVPDLAGLRPRHKRQTARPGCSHPAAPHCCRH